MNDSKNMILAVAISALILLGWTWASNRYFPTTSPQSTKVVDGKVQPSSTSALSTTARIKFLLSFTSPKILTVRGRSPGPPRGGNGRCA